MQMLFYNLMMKLCLQSFKRFPHRGTGYSPPLTVGESSMSNVMTDRTPSTLIGQHSSTANISKASPSSSGTSLADSIASYHVPFNYFSSRRCLASFGFMDSEMQRLKKEYVIAEDAKVDDVLEKIGDLLRQCDVQNDVFVFKEVPKIGNSGKYVHDMLLNQTCVRKETTTWSTLDVTTGERCRRLGHLVLVVEQLLKCSKHIRLREIAYKYPTVYRSHTVSDDDVSQLSATLEITRESLNIVASPKGSIIGPIQLYINGRLLLDGLLGGVDGCRIPIEVHRVNEIRMIEQVSYILVVEKETIFQALTGEDFHLKQSCILLTGKGQPDVATRILLRKLRDCLEVPVYAFDNLLITVPDLVWIGLFPHEVKPQHRGKLGSCSKSQQTMLKNMCKKFERIPDMFDRLSAMHLSQATADIEMIEKHDRLPDYIIGKIKAHQDSLQL